MRFEFRSNAINKALIGYLQQNTIPEGSLLPYISSKQIDLIDYISPLPETRIYSTTADGVQIGTRSFALFGHETYRMILGTPSASVEFIFYTSSGSETETHSSTEMSNNVNSFIDFKTPETTHAVSITVTSSYEIGKVSVVKYPLLLENETIGTHYYFTKYPIAYNASVDECIIVDENNNILSKDEYSISKIAETSILFITSSEIGKQPYYIHYPCIINGGSVLKKEAIDSLVYSETYSIFPTKGSNRRSPFLFLNDGDYPVSMQSLCIREQVFVEQQNEAYLIYSTSPTSLNYAYNTSRITNHNRSIIYKEQVTRIATNRIQTKHPIRVKYSGSGVALNVHDYCGDVVFSSANTDGINIYINNIIVDNSHIIGIFGEDGIVVFDSDLSDGNISVTYTTDPYQDIEIVDSIFEIDNNYTMFLPPSSVYIPMYRGLMSDDNLLHFTSDTPATIENSASSISEYYPHYIAIDDNTTLKTSSFNLDGCDFISVVITYIGELNIVSAGQDETLTTISLSDSATITTVVTRIDNADDIAYIMLEGITNGSIIYEASICAHRTVSSTIYYTKDGVNGYNLYNLSESPTNLESIDNLIQIGSFSYRKYKTSQLYDFIQINKRGGGINTDEIIKNVTGYDRLVQFPLSYDYGDIADADNMPLNPKKYLIITLPISLIAGYVAKFQNVNLTTSAEELRIIAINMIYSRIREHLPVGAFFKIYDETGNPWPEEIGQ